MRRTTTAVVSTAALAGALTFGTAYATQAGSGGSPEPSAESSTATPTPVLNKNGHEVNQHAAKGQARAAAARAKNAGKHSAKRPAATPTATPTAEPSSSPETGPNEHAGTRPDTHALPTGTDHG